MSGVTTLVDLSVAWDGWLDDLEASGLRAVFAPMYRSARWYTDNGHLAKYEWDEKAGEAAMAAAMKLLDQVAADPTGRLSGMVSPSQIDTCSAELIQASYAEAETRKLPFQIHAAQSVVEFHEITRRHGMTPVEWLESLDVLGPDLDHRPRHLPRPSSSVHWPATDDMGALRETGTNVAHCPIVFQRRGIAMQSFGRYMSPPASMSASAPTPIRTTCWRNCGRLHRLAHDGGGIYDLRTSDVFNAATLGGANRCAAATSAGSPRAPRPTSCWST